MRRSAGKGVRCALHTPTAVRIMGSRPPAGQEPDPRALLRLDRHTKVRVITAAVTVLLLLGAVLVMGASKGIIGPLETGPSVTARELTTRGFLEISITVDGWDEELSTPAIVRLSDLSTGAVRYHAVRTNAHETLELEAGTYEVGCISPVNADGGMYRVPPPEQAEVTATHTTNRLLKLEPLPAAEATREDYQAVLDEARIAVEQGDDSLQGEAGVQLLEQLRRNVEASPNYTPLLVEPELVPDWLLAQESGNSYSAWVPGAYSSEPTWSAPVVSAEEISPGDSANGDGAGENAGDADTGSQADGTAAEGGAADGTDTGDAGSEPADDGGAEGADTGGQSGQDSGTGDAGASGEGEAASTDSPSDASAPAAAEGAD